MYTIKQAASRSGVSVQLLRAWERRYGIVEPARTASGYRLYDDASIDRLRAMRLLVEDGWTPSNAAGHLLETGDDGVERVLQAAVAAAPDGAPAADGRAAGLAEEFVDAARTLDEERLERILDDMFVRGSFERVAGEHLMPAMVAVGEGWASGDIDVAAEHAASGAVARRLGMALHAAARPNGDRPVVLVGLPPGARHELGALAFATAARRAGLGVRYLGADLPVDDWVEAAVQTHAAGVVIGVVMEDDVPAATKVAQALRAARPDLLVAIGGRAATAIGLSDDVVVPLPEDLADAVEIVRRALRA
jgi:DNA-binding transcriptional MerR regulator/methylmalonyl-CoA mutase cobalamin-binding subunit